MPISLKSGVLKKCALFYGCKDAEIDEIFSKATQLSVKAGDPVFVVNDPSQFVYIVVSGAINIVAQGNIRNQFQKIATINPNEHFGEFSALANDRHHNSAFARESSELLCIQASDYLAIIREHPQVARNQIEILIDHYIRNVCFQFSLPILKDATSARFDRAFAKLKPMKLPATRKAVPIHLESNILTVAFCVPLSKDLIRSVQDHFPGYKIKFVLIEEDQFEPLRKMYLNLYSGLNVAAGAPSLNTKASMPGGPAKNPDFEDLRASTLLLNQLPKSLFKGLIPHFTVNDFAEGEIIFSSDQSSDSLYFVGTGQVELCKHVETLDVEISFLKAEQYDFFFDTRLFGKGGPQVTAIAKSTCRIFSLSRSAYNDLLKRSDFAVPFAIALAQLGSTLNKSKSEFELFSGYNPLVDIHTEHLLPLSKILKTKVLPLELQDRDLTLGVITPKKEIIDDVIDSHLRGFSVKMCLITEENFAAWTADARVESGSEETVTVFRNSRDDNRLLKVASTDATLALEQILRDAIEVRASDIHFEPNEKFLVVRFRIDGSMTQLWGNIHPEVGESIVRRVKVLAEMNIAEMRLPQDGQFRFQKEKLVSAFRVSSVPTRYGEKLVLRTTGRKNSVIPLQMLAPDARLTKFFNRLVKYQQGIFFITGPTGSGKSTTLYSILNELNTPDKSVVTIEDPIEANISGINQIEIDPSIGLTHESILRNVLRQDPDVIMIGEIRDQVSMQLALDSALAGQLVLATIHAGNTFEVIPRIKELGGSTAHIASGLIGVMAQRLVRCLCTSCKKAQAVSSKEIEVFKQLHLPEPITQVMTAVGCPKCNFTGFSGQIPIFEFWEKTMRVHNALMDEAPSEQIMRVIRESNMESLTTYGLKMVAQGLTTLSELNDVLFGITDLMAS